MASKIFFIISILFLGFLIEHYLKERQFWKKVICFTILVLLSVSSVYVEHNDEVESNMKKDSVIKMLVAKIDHITSLLAARDTTNNPVKLKLDSLNSLENNRPRLRITDCRLVKEKIGIRNYGLEVLIGNIGQKSATNIEGRVYIITNINNQLDLDMNSTVSIEKSYILIGGMGNYIGFPFYIVNPDEHDLTFEIFYRFELNYTDLLGNKYSDPFTIKISPFQKGEPNLSGHITAVKQWEADKIDSLIHPK